MLKRKYKVAKLRLPTYDAKDMERPFCGPYAIQAITGHNYRDVQASINHYSGRRPRAAVKGLSNRIALAVLRSAGYHCTGVSFSPNVAHQPTLARFLRERDKELRGKLLLINVTRHYVVVQGIRFIDTHTRDIVTIRKAPHRRKRVQRYWIIE